MESEETSVTPDGGDVPASEPVMHVDSYVILFVSICIFVFNALTILVYWKTNVIKPSFINTYFFLSLTVADLCFGAFVTPFSFWTSRYDTWVFDAWFCHIEAYLAAILWVVSLYSLMWMSIDHFLAIRKIERYENIMTPIKSKCWVAFIWCGAIFYSCPPLFGVANARYYQEAYICIADWRLQKAYLLTSGALICIPPLITIICSNCFIFTRTFKENAMIFEKAAAFNSRPDAYIRNFVISIVFFLSWLPWLCVEMYELIKSEEPSSVHPSVHFYAMWLAIGNSAWKFLIYVFFDHDFRAGLKLLYMKVCVCRCPWALDRNTPVIYANAGDACRYWRDTV